jgi:NADH-quinone oxidoreductase subunit E
MNNENTLKIVQNHKAQRNGLISILEDIQTEYRCLPEEALNLVAEKTGRSLVDIYSVATFYRMFSLKPKGRNLICTCLGTACHVRGAPSIVEEFGNQLGISGGETTSDKEFTLETVNCLGACALGPVVVVNGHYFTNVTTKKVSRIIDEVRKGLNKTDIQSDQSIFPVKVSCIHCKKNLVDDTYNIDGYPSIRLNVNFSNKIGWFRFSSLYGNKKIETEYDIPVDSILEFVCPYCNKIINSDEECTDCFTPFGYMDISGGGRFKFCTRYGCKTHMLDL